MQIVEKRAWSESFTSGSYQSRAARRGDAAAPVAALLSSTSRRDGEFTSSRQAGPGARRFVAAARRRPAERRPRDLLLTTWPGRLFIISAALKIIVALTRLAGEMPAFVQVLSSAATIGLIVVGRVLRLAVCSCW